MTYSLQLGSLGEGECRPFGAEQCSFEFSLADKGLFTLQIFADGIEVMSDLHILRASRYHDVMPSLIPLRAALHRWAGAGLSGARQRRDAHLP